MVGLRTGARTVGAGGHSITFVMDRSPATMVTFLSSGRVKRSVRFSRTALSLGFTTKGYVAYLLGVISAPMHDEPDSRRS